MCGILGYIGEIKEDAFLKCLNTLSHRGPNGYKVKTLDGATFGHRRLSILDVSDKGSQPMSYADQRYWITYNGEIYNFIEIRKELVSLGYTFQSESDTEVILASFIEWKEKCLEKFNGMWAFAIWDSIENTLFISRDRFGIKPFFYSTKENLKDNGSFVFASEMKAITPTLKEITPNSDLVKDLKNIFYYEATDVCLIKEIKRFPAGHYAWVKNGKIKMHRFWNTLDHITPNTSSYEDQVEKFRELFLNSCALRMRADVPIGTALSGGLDSSAVFSSVAHLAHEENIERASSDWQNAFCATFPGTPMDEKEYAKKVTDHLHLNLEEVVIDPSKHLDKLYTYMYLFEDIYITSPIPFITLYKEMRTKGIEVTLDGHGADEIFGGYSFDYTHILHDNFFNPKAIREVTKSYFESKIDDEQFKKESKSLFIIKHVLKNIVKVVFQLKNKSKYMHHKNWKKLDYFTQKLFISSHETVLPTLLRNYDRYSMINGVEIRMPFMDYNIVTYALSLPWQSKIRNGYTKAIVRDAIAPYMPKSIAYRKTKIGWNSPTTEWIQGPMKDFFVQMIESKEFSDSTFIDAKELRSRTYALISNTSATFNDGEILWRDLSPFFWEQGFLKKVKEVAQEINLK